MELQIPPIELTADPARNARRATEAAAQSGDSGRIREAAEQFEAVFLAQMLSPMFETLGTDGMFGGGSGERIYRSLMVEEYGKAIAHSGGVGIADQVEQEMLKLQEVRQ